jgi:hypothetical protein
MLNILKDDKVFSDYFLIKENPTDKTPKKEKLVRPHTTSFNSTFSSNIFSNKSFSDQRSSNMSCKSY